MTPDLFADERQGQREAIGPGACILHGFALPHLSAILSAIDTVTSVAPWRHMVTPCGFVMSVAMSNAGPLGWTSDRRGYRYTAIDPQTGQPWPPLPEVFEQLAHDAALAAGFEGFVPDACLINRYEPGARLSLHQDKNERDLSAPIVSVSLGMSAVFLWGGSERSDKAARIGLQHGDVVVWGGEDRLRYHGVLPLKDQPHPVLGSQRLNLTFRRAA
jgi:alkylated DNA repair protein (DNA oxidative demethylase)